MCRAACATRQVTLDERGNVLVTIASDGYGTLYDYATIKYSNAGVPLWTNRYNGPANKSDYYGLERLPLAGEGLLLSLRHHRINATLLELDVSNIETQGSSQARNLS